MRKNKQTVGYMMWSAIVDYHYEKALEVGLALADIEDYVADRLREMGLPLDVIEFREQFGGFFVVVEDGC